MILICFWDDYGIILGCFFNISACFKNIFGYLLQYYWDDFWHILGNYFFNCFSQFYFLTAFTHYIEADNLIKKEQSN